VRLTATMTRLPLLYTARCFSLILVSALLFPFMFSTTFLALFVSRCLSYLGISPKQSHKAHGYERSLNVLVTGVGMAKGLALARAFYLEGHYVVGVDLEGSGIPCPGRFSQSLHRFRPIYNQGPKEDNPTYRRQLLRIVKEEGIDLLVSCSGVANASEDAEAKELIEQQTGCRCVQLGVQETQKLHEKHNFMREVKRLGLPTPETHTITAHEDVLRILADSQAAHPERRFILKPAKMEDVHRGNMMHLPLDAKTENKAHVHSLPISPTRPWILQQFIPGGEEYCTHALIVRGQVKCFVACPSSDMLMHYRPLPRSSLLSRAMLAFTREFVYRTPSPETFTGHLSFDFMVQDSAADEGGIERSLYPIECNPRAHTAVVLFNTCSRARSAMVDAYVSTLDRSMAQRSFNRKNGLKEELIVSPGQGPPRYWIGHDLTSLVLQPTMRWVVGGVSIRGLVGSYLEFLTHLCAWKEGTFELWDPLPALVLYHVYWPLRILSAWLRGHQWSRLNVSTTKMFRCG
jgi:catechol O-methyltransferase